MLSCGPTKLSTQHHRAPDVDAVDYEDVFAKSLPSVVTFNGRPLAYKARVTVALSVCCNSLN
jgi:hypothetical protein